MLLRRSTKSKRVRLANLTSDKVPSDKENTMPKTVVITKKMMAERVRLHLVCSSNQAVSASKREMALVRAATANNIKNIEAKIEPALPKVLNTLGRTQNTNPGPPAGSNPQLNTAGKMERPAKTAMSVSQTVIHIDVLKMLSFTGM